MIPYEPEMGQECFGQDGQPYECPMLLTAALTEIRLALDRVQWNRLQTDYDSPFLNTANRFECPAFRVHAYNWSHEQQPFNFEWKDVRVNWYKHYHRGTSVNRPITPDEIAVLLEQCLNALTKFDEETWRLYQLEDGV
jgi:hypothetical protein